MQPPQLVNIYEFRLKRAHQMQNFLWQVDVQPPYHYVYLS